MPTSVIRVDEVAERLGCSTNFAYKVIRQLNAELKSKGYVTISGRVPRSYFEKRCGLDHMKDR